MLREILKKLSGAQITTMVVAALFVPGAVGAAVVFQDVAIVDPGNGMRSYVDFARRLAVYDPVAGYRNHPSNMVKITVSNTHQCESLYQYAVPSGKALVITAISGYEMQYQSTVSYAGINVFDGPGCSGKLITSHVSSVSTAAPVAPIALNLGVGTAVPAGKTVSVASPNNIGYTFFYGYLVPASLVPAAAVASNEAGAVAAADVAAKQTNSK